MPDCYICQTTESVKAYGFAGGPWHLCKRCHSQAKRRFNSRRGKHATRIVPIPSRREWIEALKAAWDESCFRCTLSQVALDPSDRSSPLYPTLDHRDPSKESGGWQVVAAAVNDMKSDLDTDEFRSATSLLARLLCRGEQPGDRNSLEQLFRGLRHWKGRGR